MSSYKFNGIREAHIFWSEWVEPTVRILTGNAYDRVDKPEGGYDYVQRYAGRPWFIQQRTRHDLHPAVAKMFDLYRPDGWASVILEWPHKSLTDPNRLAYTRDEKSAMYEGDSDKKALVTTIGKYLTRHWPDVPSDVIRDIVAQYTYGGSIRIFNTLPEMVQATINGPRSCMSPAFNLLGDDGVERHPYAVYDPSLGWSMAVRSEGSEVLGRCLLWTDPDEPDRRGYVRSYKRERNESSHSGADEAIEAHLKSNGYTKWYCWQENTPIKRIPLRRGGYLMPYIDGSTQRVEEAGQFFIVCDGGAIDASNTGGMSGTYANTCECCGDGFDDDDGGWAGPHEDDHICDSCICDEYTYVYGRRGNQYYIRNDRSVYVGDEYYDQDYLSDNGIVELHNGDYAHQDNAVFIESSEEYYEEGDDDICYAEDTEQHELTVDCWKCAESGNWYTDDTDHVDVDGEWYHPDHAPEVDDEDDEEDTDTTDTTDTTETI